jgi:hypothetical protein
MKTMLGRALRLAGFACTGPAIAVTAAALPAILRKSRLSAAWVTALLSLIPADRARRARH